MKISLVQQGLLDPSQLQAWSREKQRAVDAGVRAGMRAAVPAVKVAMQREARRAFSVKTAKFLNAWGAKVYDARRDRPPMMLAGALRMPWVSIFETGGTVAPKQGRGLLIPLVRTGGKRFAAQVRELLRAGNAFFVNVRGRVILFAENLAETRSATRRYASRFRKAIGGGRVKEIPIAVLVPRVQIQKRTRIRETVTDQLPAIARSIQNAVRV